MAVEFRQAFPLRFDHVGTCIGDELLVRQFAEDAFAFLLNLADGFFQPGPFSAQIDQAAERQADRCFADDDLRTALGGRGCQIDRIDTRQTADGGRVAFQAFLGRKA